MTTPARDIEDRVLQLVLDEFARLDILAEVSREHDGYHLALPNGAVMFLAGLTKNALDSDPEAWAAMAASQVGSFLASLKDAPPESLGEAELRARIRTRLIDGDYNDEDEWGRIVGLPPAETAQTDFPYARKFAPGVIQVLCVDYPQTVRTLDAETLPKMALPADELFDEGQKNTDAEAIDEMSQVDELVSCIAGDSLFTASKAGNFDALVPKVIGPAPMGVIFAIPNRNVLLYSVVKAEDCMERVIAVTNIVDGIGSDPGFNHRGGLVSPYTYYWAPDGTVERVGGRYYEADGTSRIAIVDTGALHKYVPGSTDVRPKGWLATQRERLRIWTLRSTTDQPPASVFVAQQKRLWGWAAGLALAWLFSFLIVNSRVLANAQYIPDEAAGFALAAPISLLALPVAHEPTVVGGLSLQGLVLLAAVPLATLAQCLSKLISGRTTFREGLSLGAVWGVLLTLFMPVILPFGPLGEAEIDMVITTGQALAIGAATILAYFVGIFLMVGVVGNLLSMPFFKKGKGTAANGF
ncbi:MAG: hypothetical protein FWE94_03695 [Coriobacteriia bacterium]|nr:hypothetical protein [Coriobacteriia bacterium]